MLRRAFTLKLGSNEAPMPPLRIRRDFNLANSFRLAGDYEVLAERLMARAGYAQRNVGYP